MNLFVLHSTSTVYMDGSAIFHVKRKDKPGIVQTLRLFPEEAERLEGLFRIQADEAWQAGWGHYRTHFDPTDPEFGNNPYRDLP